MKSIGVIEQVAGGLTGAGVVVLIAWLGFNWAVARRDLILARYAISQQDETIALKTRTADAYEKAAGAYQRSSNDWRERYEQLRWQLRTKQPNERR